MFISLVSEVNHCTTSKMFKLILICAVIGLAAALPVSDEHAADVVKSTSDVRPDGFDFGLETSNHISSQRSGDVHGNIHGTESWISPEGVEVVIKYVADENGYQPQSDVLPTPHPIPEEIVRALKWIEANPHKE